MGEVLNEHALALRPEPGMPEVVQLGQLMAASGFFQDTKDAAQAIVKIIAGRELGFGPVAAMTGIHIVQGRITLSANLIAAAIRRSGRYDYRIRELTAQVCRLEFFERGTSAGVTDFTWKDAETAQLASKPIWKQYPRNMLFARAMSNGARFFCPDVFGGPIYTPEELGAEVRVTEDGALEVGAVPPAAAPPAAPRSERARAIAAGMDAAIAEADAEGGTGGTGPPEPGTIVPDGSPEPVTEATRLACAAFADEVHAANPKYKPKLLPDAAGERAWVAWLAEKRAAWTVSELNPKAAVAPT